GELQRRDLRDLVRLGVRAQPQPPLAHGRGHPLDVALEHVPVDQDVRGVDFFGNAVHGGSSPCRDSCGSAHATTPTSPGGRGPAGLPRGGPTGPGRIRQVGGARAGSPDRVRRRQTAARARTAAAASSATRSALIAAPAPSPAPDAEETIAERSPALPAAHTPGTSV